MRFYWRKFMIVAVPMDTESDTDRQMAAQWNAVYLHSGLNRYFTMGAAEMDAEQHADSWGRYIKFGVVDRATWHEGWV